VHLRHAGRTTSFGPGEVVPLDRLRHPHRAGASPPRSGLAVPVALAPPAGLLADVSRHHDEFDRAVVEGDAEAAVSAVLAAEQTMVDWAADPLQSDEPDRARALVREMVVRLGDAARAGMRDPREIVAPFVEALLAVRAAARASNDWTTADEVRNRLTSAGVEVNDSPEGTSWSLE
jgi:cysteinyl-tRNA synthetase